MRQELDVVNETAQSIILQGNVQIRADTERDIHSLNQLYGSMITSLQSNLDHTVLLSNQWDDLEMKISFLEESATGLEQKVLQLNDIVKSRKQLEETRSFIQELFVELESHMDSYSKAKKLSEVVLQLLGSRNELLSDQINKRLQNISEREAGLTVRLTEHVCLLDKHFRYIEDVFKNLSRLQDTMSTYLEQSNEFDVYDTNVECVERQFDILSCNVKKCINEGKELIDSTSFHYKNMQSFIPCDIQQELMALELLNERLAGIMEAMESEIASIKSLRLQCSSMIEEIQKWMKNAEIQIHDRSNQPTHLKEIINKLNNEVDILTESLEKCKESGKLIMEKTRSYDEKKSIENTLDEIAKQLNQSKCALANRKQLVEDSIDAWARFLNLYQMVILWVTEKEALSVSPLKICTLLDAKEALDNYSAAVNSVKAVSKHLSEMGNILEIVLQVSVADDLKDKLHYAEESKISVEALLFKRHGLLQEMTEEWEQCEKKIREIRVWVETSKSLAESMRVKNQSLKEQLGFCEKCLTDINVQKTKLSLSIEKLQVHFRCEIGCDFSIGHHAEEISTILDEFADIMRKKTEGLEKALKQIDAYQQQIQALKFKIIEEENSLRELLIPINAPLDIHCTSEQQAMLQTPVVYLNQEDYKNNSLTIFKTTRNENGSNNTYFILKKSETETYLFNTKTIQESIFRVLPYEIMWNTEFGNLVNALNATLRILNPRNPTNNPCKMLHINNWLESKHLALFSKKIARIGSKQAVIKYNLLAFGTERLLQKSYDMSWDTFLHDSKLISSSQNENHNEKNEHKIYKVKMGILLALTKCCTHKIKKNDTLMIKNISSIESNTKECAFNTHKRLNCLSSSSSIKEFADKVSSNNRRKEEIGFLFLNSGGRTSFSGSNKKNGKQNQDDITMKINQESELYASFVERTQTISMILHEKHLPKARINIKIELPIIALLVRNDDVPNQYEVTEKHWFTRSEHVVHPKEINPEELYENFDVDLEEIFKSLSSAENLIEKLSCTNLMEMLHQLQVILQNLESCKGEVFHLRFELEKTSNNYKEQEILSKMEEKVLDLIFRCDNAIKVIQGSMQNQTNLNAEVAEYHNILLQAHNIVFTVTEAIKSQSNLHTYENIKEELDKYSRYHQCIKEHITNLQNMIGTDKCNSINIKTLKELFMVQVTETIITLKKYLEVVSQRIFNLNMQIKQTIESGSLPAHKLNDSNNESTFASFDQSNAMRTKVIFAANNKIQNISTVDNSVQTLISKDLIDTISKLEESHAELSLIEASSTTQNTPVLSQMNYKTSKAPDTLSLTEIFLGAENKNNITVKEILATCHYDCDEICNLNVGKENASVVSPNNQNMIDVGKDNLKKGTDINELFHEIVAINMPPIETEITSDSTDDQQISSVVINLDKKIDAYQESSETFKESFKEIKLPIIKSKDNQENDTDSINMFDDRHGNTLNDMKTDLLRSEMKQETNIEKNRTILDLSSIDIEHLESKFQVLDNNEALNELDAPIEIALCDIQIKPHVTDVGIKDIIEVWPRDYDSYLAVGKSKGTAESHHSRQLNYVSEVFQEVEEFWPICKSIGYSLLHNYIFDLSNHALEPRIYAQRIHRKQSKGEVKMIRNRETEAFFTKREEPVVHFGVKPDCYETFSHQQVENQTEFCSEERETKEDPSNIHPIYESVYVQTSATKSSYSHEECQTQIYQHTTEVQTSPRIELLQARVDAEIISDVKTEETQTIDIKTECEEKAIQKSLELEDISTQAKYESADKNLQTCSEDIIDLKNAVGLVVDNILFTAVHEVETRSLTQNKVDKVSLTEKICSFDKTFQACNLSEDTNKGVHSYNVEIDGKLYMQKELGTVPCSFKESILIDEQEEKNDKLNKMTVINLSVEAVKPVILRDIVKSKGDEHRFSTDAIDMNEKDSICQFEGNINEYVRIDKPQEHKEDTRIPKKESSIASGSISGFPLKKNNESHTICRQLNWPSERHTIKEYTLTEKVETIRLHQQRLDAAIRHYSIDQIESNIINIINHIFDWLQNLEERFSLLGLPTESVEDNWNDYGQLKKELESIEDERNMLQKYFQLIYSNQLMSDKSMLSYLDVLNDHLEVMKQKTIEIHSKNVEHIGKLKSSLEMMESTKTRLNNIQDSLNSIVSNDANFENKLLEMDKLEVKNQAERENIVNMLYILKYCEHDFQCKKIIGELTVAYQNSKTIDKNISLEREKIFQFKQLAEDYEQTLNEFSKIIAIADRLVDNKVKSASLEQLHEEMQTHRKFFINLNHCRCILESLENNIDNETREKHGELHNNLYRCATQILDKAAGRAQNLALAASRWAIIEKIMEDESKWLQIAQQRVPDLSDITSVNFDRYYTLYQSLSLDFKNHHSKMLQGLQSLYKLQGLVSTTKLIEEGNEAIMTLLKLRKEVTLYLQRILIFRESWMQFVASTERLESWMNITEQELKRIEWTPPNRTLGESMGQFWDIKAQFEVYNKLRAISSDNFEKSLQIIPLADEVHQRQFQSQLEDRWNNLADMIGHIQAKILSSISENIPLTEKLDLLEQELKDMTNFLTNTTKIIKSEDELNLYFEKLQIFNNRLGLISNELVRVGLLAMDQSEKVNDMFKSLQQISTVLAEETEMTSILKIRLTSLKEGILNISREQSAMAHELNDCENSEKLESSIIEKAFDSCLEIRNTLNIQWQYIMQIRQMLHTLPLKLRVTVLLIDEENNISKLQDNYSNLLTRCANIIELLKIRLELWQNYIQQLEVVQQSSEETNFMMEVLEIHGNVDYERLRKATERLEGLALGVMESSAPLEELRKLSKLLIETCEAQVADQVDLKTQMTLNAWRETSENLNARCSNYKRAVQLWERFNQIAIAFECSPNDTIQALDELEKSSFALSKIEKQDTQWEMQQEDLKKLEHLAAEISSNLGSDATNILWHEIDNFKYQLKKKQKNIEELKSQNLYRAEREKKSDLDVMQMQKDLMDLKQKISDHELLCNVEEDSKSDYKICAKELTCNVEEDQFLLLQNELIWLSQVRNGLENLQEEYIFTKSLEVQSVLKIWGYIFRKTWAAYRKHYRSLLCKQEPKAWSRIEAYLKYVQAYLYHEVPCDYLDLKEDYRLCDIHESFLVNHKFVLFMNIFSHEKDGTHTFMEYVLLVNDLNELLLSILQRKKHIQNELNVWKMFLCKRSEISVWMDEHERQKSYWIDKQISMKKIPVILKRINILKEAFPVAFSMLNELQDYELAVKKYSKENAVLNYNLECNKVMRRIIELQTSIENLDKCFPIVLDGKRMYDEEIKILETIFNDSLMKIEIMKKNIPYSNNALEKILKTLSEEKKRIADTFQNIESIKSIIENLKKYVCRRDIKSMYYYVSILLRTKTDLDLEFSMLINLIRETISFQTNFNNRYNNMLRWIDEIMTNSAGIILQSTHQNKPLEILLREEELNWILFKGNELLVYYRKTSDEKSCEAFQVQLDDLAERWEKLNHFLSQKTNKISELRKTLFKLEERISANIEWLYKTELQFSEPLAFESLDTQAIEKQMKNFYKLQRSIEKQSKEITELLNISEMLLSDETYSKSNVNLMAIRRTTENLENRWKHLCSSSAVRRENIMMVWNLLQQINALTVEKKEWITQHEIWISNFAAKQCNQSEEKDLTREINEILNIIKQIESKEIEIDALIKLLHELFSYTHLDQKSVERLIMPAKNVIFSYRNLTSNAYIILETIDKTMRYKFEFVNIQGKTLICLSQVDANFEILKYVENDSETNARSLVHLWTELDKIKRLIEKAEKLGMNAIALGESSEMIDQLIQQSLKLWNDIASQIAKKNTLLEESNQVNTLSATSLVQVNTLSEPTLKYVTAKHAYLLEIAHAVEDCRHNLHELQLIIYSKDKTDSSKVGKVVGTCQSSIDLTQHLNKLLLEECSCDEDEAYSDTVRDLVLYFDALQHQWQTYHQQSKEESYVGCTICPLCTESNWQQIDNEMWRLEQWLKFAESIQHSEASVPSEIEQLEDVIQDHGEFILDLKSHKTLVNSLAMLETHLSAHSLDTDKAMGLKDRLKLNYGRWDTIYNHATQRQNLLQTALMNNLEFHQTIEELVLWLENTEDSIKLAEPIDLSENQYSLEAKLQKFKMLFVELERCEPRVLRLQHAANDILGSVSYTEQFIGTFKRLTELRLKLQSLQNLIGVYISEIEYVLHLDKSYDSALLCVTLNKGCQDMMRFSRQAEEDIIDNTRNVRSIRENLDTSVFYRSYRFLSRIARTSLPIQALLLLLLGAATLVPQAEDYSCLMTNTFMQSMEQGQPPL